MLTEERLLELWEAMPKSYGKTMFAFARAVEAEARKMALEEAAKMCEAQTRPSMASDGETHDEAIAQCAASIRALP